MPLDLCGIILLIGKKGLSEAQSMMYPFINDGYQELPDSD